MPAVSPIPSTSSGEIRKFAVIVMDKAQRRSLKLEFRGLRKAGTEAMIVRQRSF